MIQALNEENRKRKSPWFQTSKLFSYIYKDQFLIMLI